MLKFCNLPRWETILNHRKGCRRRCRSWCPYQSWNNKVVVEAAVAAAVVVVAVVVLAVVLLWNILLVILQVPVCVSSTFWLCHLCQHWTLCFGSHYCVTCHLESALWFEIDLTESGCCHCCHSYLTQELPEEEYECVQYRERGLLLADSQLHNPEKKYCCETYDTAPTLINSNFTNSSLIHFLD